MSAQRVEEEAVTNEFPPARYIEYSGGAELGPGPGKRSGKGLAALLAYFLDSGRFAMDSCHT